MHWPLCGCRIYIGCNKLTMLLLVIDRVHARQMLCRAYQAAGLGQRRVDRARLQRNGGVVGRVYRDNTAAVSSPRIC
jgi:hypothetical protein